MAASSHRMVQHSRRRSTPSHSSVTKSYNHITALFATFMSTENVKFFMLRQMQNDDDLFFSAAEVEVDNLGGVHGRTVAHRDCWQLHGCSLTVPLLRLRYDDDDDDDNADWRRATSSDLRGFSQWTALSAAWWSSWRNGLCAEQGCAEYSKELEFRFWERVLEKLFKNTQCTNFYAYLSSNGHLRIEFFRL